MVIMSAAFLFRVRATERVCLRGMVIGCKRQVEPPAVKTPLSRQHEGQDVNGAYES